VCFSRVADALPAQCLAAVPMQTSLSLLLLELSSYCVSAVRLHVNAADALVRCGVDRDDSR
jgi:hypothetical protein